MDRRPEWSYYTQRVAYWNEVYDSIMAGQCCLVIKDDMKEYERMAKEHDEKQPFIKEQLIEAIKAYNCVTYRQLSLQGT